MAYKLFANNKGFTITEVMIGSGLILTVAVGAMTGFSSLSKLLNKNDVQSTAEDRVVEIIENIRNKPTSQIIQYSDNPSNLLNRRALKMAWSNFQDVPATECSQCPGRYGYVITPVVAEMPDLYLVTIKFTHKEWGTEPKTYEFLVSK